MDRCQLLATSSERCCPLCILALPTMWAMLVSPLMRVVLRIAAPDLGIGSICAKSEVQSRRRCDYALDTFRWERPQHRSRIAAQDLHCHPSPPFSVHSPRKRRSAFFLLWTHRWYGGLVTLTRHLPPWSVPAAPPSPRAWLAGRLRAPSGRVRGVRPWRWRGPLGGARRYRRRGICRSA